MAAYEETEWDQRCLGCGGQVAEVLWNLRSVLCHDCRDLRRGVDPMLLREWAEAQRDKAARNAVRVADARA